jgi:hypothetical protein
LRFERSLFRPLIIETAYPLIARHPKRKQQDCARKDHSRSTSADHLGSCKETWIIKFAGSKSTGQENGAHGEAYRSGNGTIECGRITAREFLATFAEIFSLWRSQSGSSLGEFPASIAQLTGRMHEKNYSEEKKFSQRVEEKRSRSRHWLIFSLLGRAA